VRPLRQSPLGPLPPRAKPTAAELQTLLPDAAPSVLGRRKRRRAIVLGAHTVKRQADGVQRKVHRVKSTQALPNSATGQPGWAFDVPGPDPGRLLLWASISLPWQYWEWSGEWGNDLSSDVRIDGSVDWLYFLTGNPYYFPGYSPTFLGASGHFTFYTLVPPGNAGFDVAWLVEPNEDTKSSYTPFPDQPSELSILLSTQVGDVLKLWFGLNVFNPEVNAQPWYGPGSFNGGAQSIYVVYAYSGSPLPEPDINGMVFAP
jgi:hypothetical protein